MGCCWLYFRPFDKLSNILLIEIRISSSLLSFRALEHLKHSKTYNRSQLLVLFLFNFSFILSICIGGFLLMFIAKSWICEKRKTFSMKHFVALLRKVQYK